MPPQPEPNPSERVSTNLIGSVPIGSVPIGTMRAVAVRAAEVGEPVSSSLIGWTYSPAPITVTFQGSLTVDGEQLLQTFAEMDARRADTAPIRADLEPVLDSLFVSDFAPRASHIAWNNEAFLPETEAMRAEREQYEQRRQHWYWRRWWDVACWWVESRDTRRQLLRWRPWTPWGAWMEFEAWLEEQAYHDYVHTALRWQRASFRFRERIRLALRRHRKSV